MRRVYFIFMILLSHDVSLGETSGSIVSYSFTQKPACFLDTIKHHLASTNWTGVSSTLACAHKAVQSYPHSKGFFFEKGSGLCIPLILDGSNDASSEVPAGDLYVSTEHVWCPKPFQGVVYGDKNSATCIPHITPPTTYVLATSQCVSLGGWLVTVKTSEKLDLVVELANSKTSWVGLDALVEDGRYVWQQDGSELTTAVKNVMLQSIREDQDCCVVVPSFQLLINILCSEEREAICESAPLEPIC